MSVTSQFIHRSGRDSKPEGGGGQNRIARRLEDGQHAEFEVLYKRFYGSLVGFFLNRGCSRSDSEDSAQETLFRAYCGYEEFDRKASEATWLFTIASNIWKNEIRRRSAKKRDGKNISLNASRQLWREVEALASGPEALSRSALSSILAEERRRLLWQVVEGLSPQMKRCVKLYGSGLFTHKEIADILGIHVNTVKSLVSQAKEKLLQVLRRTNPESFGGAE